MNNSGTGESYCSAVLTLAKKDRTRLQGGSRWPDQVAGSWWHQIWLMGIPVQIQRCQTTGTACHVLQLVEVWKVSSSKNSCRETTLYISSPFSISPVHSFNPQTRTHLHPQQVNLLLHWESRNHQKRVLGDFPDGPVGQTPCFLRRGLGLIPGWETRFHMWKLGSPHASTKIPWAKTKTQSNQNNFFLRESFLLFPNSICHYQHLQLTHSAFYSMHRCSSPVLPKSAPPSRLKDPVPSCPLKDITPLSLPSP